MKSNKFICFSVLFFFIFSGFSAYASPMPFPKGKKCVVNGERRLCYDKQGFKDLLSLYERYKLLYPTRKSLEQAYALTRENKKLIELQEKQLKNKSRIEKELRLSLNNLKKQRKQDIKEFRRRQTINAVLTTALIVGALAGGIAIGVVIGKAQN